MPQSERPPGANFHTWAVWGSWKAGTTIRQQDVPHLGMCTISLGSVVGASLAGGLLNPGVHRRVLGVAAALGGMLTANLVTNRLLRRASSMVLEGNRLVLIDIGSATARYLSMLGPLDAPDSELMNAFLGTLRPGPAIDRGQDLLRDAFLNYDAARWETDPDRQHEYMLLANLQAILHEHMRLEPYIDAAVPSPLRRLVTTRLLSFQVGLSRPSVGTNVGSPGTDPYPATLGTLENPALVEMLNGASGWDRTLNQLTGSAARDWTKLAQRMNYITDLFRSRHLDRAVFQCLFSAIEMAQLRRGQVPDSL